MSSIINGWYYKIGEGAQLDSQAEIRNNAQKSYNGLIALGFTPESACGIIGNMYVESTMNCGQKTGNAWGLTQFYPYTRLTSYCNLHNLTWYDGSAQLQLINDEGYFTATSGDFERQWLPTTNYNITWDEYKANTNVEYCAKAYMFNNERPATDTSNLRAQWARYWYDELHGHTPTPIRYKKLQLKYLGLEFLRKGR